MLTTTHAPTHLSETQTGSTTISGKRRREAEHDDDASIESPPPHDVNSECETKRKKRKKRARKRQKTDSAVESGTALVDMGATLAAQGTTSEDSHTDSIDAKVLDTGTGTGSEDSGDGPTVNVDVETDAQPKTRSQNKRPLTAFETHLETADEDFKSLRFQHHPDIDFDDVLKKLMDKNQNDVIEHTGDGLHNTSITDVLHDTISSSTLTRDWPTEKLHACIEAVSITYSQNATIGRIFCRMYDRPIPTTPNKMKAEADSFEALTYWIFKTHGKASLIEYYQAIVDRTLVHALDDFLATYSDHGSFLYLGEVNNHRTNAFVEVFPKHEQAFLDALQPFTQGLVADLVPLKMLVSDPPIVFDQKNRVVGVHRPMDLRGRLLFNQIIASEVDTTWPSHHLAGKGGADLRTQISKLAACQGALTLLAQLAGLEKASERGEIIDESCLPSVFFVAMFMLKERDGAKFEVLASKLKLLLVFVADAVLFDEGICFDIAAPTTIPTTPTAATTITSTIPA